jgi:hypothetical protein
VRCFTDSIQGNKENSPGFTHIRVKTPQWCKHREDINFHPLENSLVLAPLESHFAYFTEFQIVKTALKGTITQKFIYW